MTATPMSAPGAEWYENGEVSEERSSCSMGRRRRDSGSHIDPVEGVADVAIGLNIANLDLGYMPATAGDVNGDGYSDPVDSLVNFTGPELAEGAVFIFHGGAETLADEPDGQYDAQQVGSHLGWTTASAGDVNGDGFVDLVAGVPRGDPCWWRTRRSGPCIPRLPGAVPFHSRLDGGWGSGRAVIGFWQASAGDVNGDGYGELAIGLPNFANGHSLEGRVVVYHGVGFGPGFGGRLVLRERSRGCRIWDRLASAGDVDLGTGTATSSWAPPDTPTAS